MVHISRSHQSGFRFFLPREFIPYTIPIIASSKMIHIHHGIILKLFIMVTMMIVIGKISTPVVQVKVHQEILVIPAP